MGKPSNTPSDRVRSQALAERSTSFRGSPKPGNILPTYEDSSISTTKQAGGLDEKQDGRGSPSGSSAGKKRHGGGANGAYFPGSEKPATGNTTADAAPQATPPPAPPPDKSEDASPGDSTLVANGGNTAKPPIPTRMMAGIKRFFVHMKNAIFHSYVNILLVFVPIGIAVEAVGLSPSLVFAMNAIAIIPLAGLLSFATEAVASRLGDTLGALLNVSFGNAVELIIFIIALVKDEIQIVQASLLGSILANLLLILGMAFLLGGLRYREQVYNSTVTQMSACLLSLSVMSLLLPVSRVALSIIPTPTDQTLHQTAFYHSFKRTTADLADQQVLKVSRGTSVVLLIVYVLYLLFQLKSHAYLYESTPQEIIDEESHPGVLADIMNSSSSSSSEDSSTTDSTDSDTSGSGSIANAGKKIKRVFTHRRHRKSSASSATGSGKHSALSSPSTTVENGTSYLDHQPATTQTARRGSAVESVNGDGAEADHEDNANGPRVRDFGGDGTPLAEGSKSTKHKKHRKKHRKRHHKKNQDTNDTNGHEEPQQTQPNLLDGPTVHTPVHEEPRNVEFAEEVEVAEPQGSSYPPTKSSFNMRQLSSRANLHRPALSKMLSNNVFVTPAPGPSQSPRPSRAPRSQSGTGLRRTSSLPDRLNRQISAPARAPLTNVVSRTDPLPPFQHQRQQLRKVRSEDADDSDDEDGDEKPQMSRTAAVVLLLCTTALVAVCAEFMVDAIPAMIQGNSSVSQAFIGLIILPIVGNAAEHVTAVTVAAKNKMDLAIGVAVGSSIQIALFVTPIVVLLGWILDTEMSLYFNIFETISLFVTAFVVNFLVLDGRSNYLEGSLLIAAYVIIAVGAFFYPARDNQSSVGSVGGSG
jgi:Ca2+:H+ antiporter